MDEQLHEDWLDAKLRDGASYIDDAGFTAGVMQKLPPARTHRSLRAIILIGVALLASAFAYVLSGEGRFVWEAIAQASLLSPAFMIGLVLVIGLMMTAGGLYAAISRADRTIA